MGLHWGEKISGLEDISAEVTKFEKQNKQRQKTKQMDCGTTTKNVA